MHSQVRDDLVPDTWEWLRQLAASSFLTAARSSVLNLKSNISKQKIKLYSVRNHYRTVFWGDDVLDSFNMVYRDEHSISDQTYQKQVSLEFYYDNF